jgi:predicted nucleic acid-binding protein
MNAIDTNVLFYSLDADEYDGVTIVNPFPSP